MLEIPADTLDALESMETLLRARLDDGTQIGATALRTIDAGGKRLRPLLVMLSCQTAGGAIDERVVRVAAGVELIHTASLIHDDVMDEAKLRRGEPTVLAEQGVARAITVGDYLFVKGYELASLSLDDDSTQLVADACAGLAEGQYAEEDLKTNADDPQLYLYVVERKTAGFIAACAEVGAYLAGVRGDDLVPYRDFGYNLGVAFQLVDDVLDATGSVEKLGKDVGNDVRNGAKGGPMVFALQAGAQRLGDVVKELYEGEGVDLTKQLAEGFARKASAAAAAFPNNDHGRTLASVASVLLHREN